MTPNTDAASYTLTSTLTQFSDWSGHIASTSVAADINTTFCLGDDTTLADAVAAVLGGTNCTSITETQLAAQTGGFAVNGKSITAINPLVIQAFTGIDNLRLNTNNLTAVPAESFANLPFLFDLYLHDNQITNVGEDAFANMTNLSRLTLRDNKLTEIPVNLYSNLPALELLYLYNNLITTIDVDAFINLPKLIRLRLYNNTIAELPLGVFDGLTATEIRLDNNSLTSLPLNLLQNHIDPSSIEIFNIADNDVATANDGDGWRITTGEWSADGFIYEFNIGHKLPGDLSVPYTLEQEGADDQTGTLTIVNGSTSGSVTVSPTLASATVPSEIWSGHQYNFGRLY